MSAWAEANMKNALIAILSLLLLVAIGTTGYYYRQSKQVAKAVASDETTDIVTFLSQFVELPSEEPTLAVVTDQSKLANAALAQKAQNDDRILLYPQAGMALLYRPSSHKLVDIYPVSAQTPTPTATSGR